MIEAAEEAKRDAAVGKEQFMKTGLPQKAVLLDLIHLTESAENTSAGFKKLNPGIPWRRLSNLRNRGLVHDYLEVDLDDVWTFIHVELSKVRRKLDRPTYPET